MFVAVCIAFHTVPFADTIARGRQQIDRQHSCLYLNSQRRKANFSRCAECALRNPACRRHDRGDISGKAVLIFCTIADCINIGVACLAILVDLDTNADVNSGLLRQRNIGTKANRRKHEIGFDVAAIIQRCNIACPIAEIIDRYYFAAQMPFDAFACQRVANAFTHSGRN